MRDVHGHIHFGADFLGNDYKAWENFFTIYNECEEILYKMCNRQGELPREEIMQYAQASNGMISSIFENGEVSIKTQEDLDLIIEALKDTRNRGINFCNMEEEGTNTIEYRMPNGTIDINIIRENIRLFGQLLNISKQMSINSEFKKEEFSALKRHNLTEREKVESLLSLLFDDEQEKSVYRQRWNTVKEGDLFVELKAEQPTFKRGDYSMREQVGKIYKDTKVDDRVSFVQMVRKVISKVRNISKIDDFQK